MQSLADDILLEDILPSLPLNDLSHFCSSFKRIYTLCQEDIIWLRRLQIHYPELVNEKPEGMTWKDYYFKISPYKKIPIWMNGKIIDYERFNTGNEIPLPKLVDKYVPKEGNLLILYTNDALTPIYSAIYLNGNLDIKIKYLANKRDLLNQIGRIILITNSELIEHFINELDLRYLKPSIKWQKQINISYKLAESLELIKSVIPFGYINYIVIHYISGPESRRLLYINIPELNIRGYCNILEIKDLINIIYYLNSSNINDYEYLSKYELCQIIEDLLIKKNLLINKEIDIKIDHIDILKL